ncbi:MAG: hypothetical protein M1840_007353 [Geoglossum simile]|nr:MAG: hypothetical protein M1840_007353 [Geoglossum simile]
MSDEIDCSQIDWSQLLDWEGDGPRIPRRAIQPPIADLDATTASGDLGPSHWPNACYGEGSDCCPALLASPPEVHPALQLPELSAVRNRKEGPPSEFDVSGRWDWMNDLHAGLLNNEGLLNGQLHPTASDPGLQAGRNSGSALPYPPATRSLHQHQANASETATDFNFVSGCRPIGEGMAQPVSGREIEAGSLTCVWPNCSSKRTFKRSYELQRHMNKHTSLVRYPCAAVNCPSRRTATFYRLDKFRDHLRNSHGLDGLFACPVPVCTSGPLPLFKFIIHIDSHTNNNERNSWYHALDALQEYDVGRAMRACPLEGCRKWLNYSDVPAHLLTHELEDLMKHKAEIAEAGYDIPSGHVICPVCNQTSASHNQFIEHLTLHHLVLDGEHYAAWRTEFRSHCYWTYLPWIGWGDRMLSRTLVCPTCGLGVFLGPNFSYTHHLVLLAPFDWINESLQKKILNLWPAFASHPVFNSILPTVYRRYDRQSWYPMG